MEIFKESSSSRKAISSRMFLGLNRRKLGKSVTSCVCVCTTGVLLFLAWTGVWASRVAYHPASPPRKGTASSSTPPAASCWRELRASSCQSLHSHLAYLNPRLSDPEKGFHMMSNVLCYFITWEYYNSIFSIYFYVLGKSLSIWLMLFYFSGAMWREFHWQY